MFQVDGLPVSGYNGVLRFVAYPSISGELLGGTEGVITMEKLNGQSAADTKRAKELLEKLVNQFLRVWKSIKGWAIRHGVHLGWNVARCDICDGLVVTLTLDVGDHDLCKRLEDADHETPF